MDRMEPKSFRPLPQIPGERFEGTLNVAQTSPIHRSGCQQRNHTTPLNEQQDHVQQSRIPARVSQKQFQNTVMLLHHDADAKIDYSRQHSAVGLQRRTAVRYLGTPPRHQQQFDGNKTPRQISTAPNIPEATSSGPASVSPGRCKKSNGQSYVEKQRETQQVHSKAHPGDISSIFQSQPSPDSPSVKKVLIKRRGGSDQPCQRRDHIRQVLSHRNEHQTASDNTPQFDLHGQSLKIQPNWPFGCNATFSRRNDSGKGQHCPLTKGEIRLLLRNPIIRDGNMGLLPTPDGVTPPRPPPHVYGIAPGPKDRRLPHLPVPRLPGLKRRNAQRRSSTSELQQNFDSKNDRFNARFRRGSAARDVNVDYYSPVELASLEIARRDPKKALYRIQEAFNESSDSESAQGEGEEAGTGQEDEIPHHPAQPMQEINRSPEQKLQHQSGGSKTPLSTEAHTVPGPGRFPLVVKGPRPAPASRSTSSSAPSTSPSSAPPTTATQPSAPASEPELEPRPEYLAQDECGCGTPGCTWAECSRIRGTFSMSAPGAVDESKPESGGRSVAETTSEDDIVSVGNGFSFLRLN